MAIFGKFCESIQKMIFVKWKILHLRLIKPIFPSCNLKKVVI